MITQDAVSLLKLSGKGNISNNNNFQRIQYFCKAREPLSSSAPADETRGSWLAPGARTRPFHRH